MLTFIQWQRHLKFEDKTSPFHYPDTLWTFDAGILIFPSPEAQSYVLYDLGSGTKSSFDLESEKKIVRRIRLKDGVLVVEWCEHEPYHQLNENEMVYRHFATAYDVKRTDDGNWSVIFRSVPPLSFIDCFVDIHLQERMENTFPRLSIELPGPIFQCSHIDSLRSLHVAKESQRLGRRRSH